MNRHRNWTVPLIGLALMCGVAAQVLITAPAFAQLNPGDLLVAEASLNLDTGSNAPSDDVILRIDRATGDRSILVDFDAAFGKGGPDKIVFAPNGEIFVSEPILDAIVYIDPITFNPSIFSGPGVGTGTDMNLDDPNGIAFLPNGDLIVAEASLDLDTGSNAPSDDVILRIDRTTGNRSILVDFDAAFGGGGPDDIAIAPNGDIFVSEPILDAIVYIDPTTFTPSIFSGLGVGTGTDMNLDDPNGIAFLPNGDLIVAEASLNLDSGSNAPEKSSILRIDQATGNRSILVDLTAAFGSNGADDIAIAPNGDIFVSDPSSAVNGIILIDPTTFTPSIFSGPGVGVGPDMNLDDPNGIAVYVPEPATLTLLVIGTVTLLMRRRMRRRG